MHLLTTYTQLGTTSNYSTTANLHNSQISTTPAMPFSACCDFTSCSQATASNSGDFSASLSQVLSTIDSLAETAFQLSLSIMSRPTVSRPISLGIKHPSGAYDQILLLSDSAGLLI
jgi:hypothetical protein